MEPCCLASGTVMLTRGGQARDYSAWGRAPCMGWLCMGPLVLVAWYQIHYYLVYHSHYTLVINLVHSGNHGVPYHLVY